MNVLIKLYINRENVFHRKLALTFYKYDFNLLLGGAGVSFTLWVNRHVLEGACIYCDT